jgi:hypothetical protein
VDQRTLVERARSGDHDAFAVLAGAALARLDAAARLIVRDRELARDVVQDTLLRAWRDLPGLRDPERFDVWLNRLLTHAAIDEARRRRRRVIEVELNPRYGRTRQPSAFSRQPSCDVRLVPVGGAAVDTRAFLLMNRTAPTIRPMATMAATASIRTSSQWGGSSRVAPRDPSGH